MQVKLPGEVGDIGFKQAMQQKWLATDKSSGEPRIVRKVRALHWYCKGWGASRQHAQGWDQMPAEEQVLWRKTAHEDQPGHVRHGEPRLQHACQPWAGAGRGEWAIVLQA